MKKGLLLLIILTVLGCNEDPETKEETVEFRFQQGKFSTNVLKMLVNKVDPNFLNGGFGIIRRTGGAVLDNDLNNLAKGKYENLYSLRINNTDDGKGDRYFPITVIVE